MRRIRKKSIVVTFRSTAEAFAAEHFCREQDLPGRMIPLPSSISAGCGLAWKAPLEKREMFPAVFIEAGIEFEAVYEIEFYETAQAE